MSQTFTPQLIEQAGYTKPELRWMVARYRGSRLPTRTFDHWICQLSAFDIVVKPNSLGLYDDDCLKVLTRLAFWLQRRKTIAQFAQIIKQEYQNAS